ncbi:MAG: SPOR domain-containing protein [Balneolaceae bacterium]|nr:SPOR domain-containing protein [Balneolaceae bacterium]
MVRIFLLSIFTAFLLIGQVADLQAQSHDRIPREYTSPDEVVTFSRNTSFQRALDVINQFAQDQLRKVIIDRTNTDGNIGIAVPAMHWRDALDLILRVNNLAMVEQQEFFEIVPYQPQQQASQMQNGAQTTAAASGEAEEIPATLDSREVRINAIFFEGNRQALQEVGVDWSSLTENTPENVGSYVGTGQQQGGGGGGGQGGGQGGTLPATSGFDDQFVAVNSVGAQSVSQNVFNALVNFGQLGNTGIRVQALFSAFEADNLGEVLASPSIRVMDGEEGRIQVGQDFSIKQRDFAGNVTDEFFSVGTILNVTPTLITRNDTTIIHLDVNAERSSVQPSSVSTIINKQQAQTQAILINGEATAIAGLYSSQISEVRRGVPILKDLPPWLFGLRYLFGFNSNDYEMRELVVLLQAEIQPSIEDRYGRLVKNKFDVLDDARQRIREELDQKEEYSPTRMDRLDENEKKEPADSLSEEQQMPEQKPQEKVSAPQEETQSENNEATEITGEDVVLDPEMVANPVPLNLGSEDEEEEQDETSEESQRVQPSDTVGTSEARIDEPTIEADNPQQEGEQSVKNEDKAGETQDFSYFVIGASFTNQENAREYSNSLKEKGFNAFILSNQTTNYHYVAYQGYKTMEAAQNGLDNIRANFNSDAWLFIKR